MPSLSGLARRISALNPLSFKRASADDPITTTLRGTAADETSMVWLLDSTASRDPADRAKWNVDVVAAFFAARTGRELTQAVADVSRAVGLADDAAERALVEERVRPFFLAVLEGRDAQVRFGDGGETFRLNKTDAGGVSRTRIVLARDEKDGHVLPAQVVDPGNVKFLKGQTTFADEEGWAVISDIDDTIKKTLTTSPTGILETTFTQQAEPIRGQPEFYRHMAQALDDPPFWYLSASPYNLYPFLHEFRDAHFPPGTVFLRNTSWQNVAGFLASLTKDTQRYKVDKMETIYKNFPRRKMVCIGDSTQSDPEAYGEMYRMHPEWVKKVFIRRAVVTELTDILPGQGNEERNKPERFETAFKDVPKDLWYVFDEPEELYERLDALVAA